MVLRHDKRSADRGRAGRVEKALSKTFREMDRRIRKQESLKMAVVVSLVEPPMELVLSSPKAEAPAKRPRAPAKRPASPAEEVDGKPAKRQRASSEEGGSLIVAKAVREYLKSLPNPVNCSAEALVTINAKLQCLLLEAAGRSHDNGRKTLKESDL